MKMNAVKKFFLDLAASITLSKITDVAAIGTAAALTPVSPYISIPLLVLAYGHAIIKRKRLLTISKDRNWIVHCNVSAMKTKLSWKRCVEHKFQN